MTGLCVEEASWQTSAARESSRSSGNYRVQDILERQFQLIQNLTMMPSAASIAETSKEYSHVAEVNPIASAREGSQGEERITEFAMSLSTTSPRREVQVYSESDVRVSSLSLRREVACAVRVRAVSHPQRQADSGSFFYFDEARWSEMISAPSHEEWNGRQYNVAQTRDGMLVWSGKVVVCWTSHFGAYGHRAAYCALGQWQIGDVITIHTVEQATAATGKDAGAYPLERERSAITTVVPEKRYTTVVELDAAVRGIVLLEKVPDEPEASLDAELRVPQQETAPPIASIGLDTNLDGKIDTYITGVDRNHDDILDFVQQQEKAPPIATTGLDTNLDGKIDTYIIGVDRNHDGIPDFIQQQVDKPRLSLIEHLSIMKDTSVADIATALGSITGYNRMRLETALNDIDSSTALGLRLEEAKQAVADMDSLFCEMDGLFNASPGFSQSEHHQFGVEQCVDFVDAINSYHDSEISDHEATRRQKAQIDKAEKVNTTTLQSKREEEKVARKKAEEEEKLRMHAEQVAHAWKQAAGSEDHESSIQSKSHDRKPDKGGDQLEAVPAHSLAAHSQQSSHEAREEEAEKEEKQKKDAHHKVEELAEKLRMQAEREVRTNAEDDARLKAGEEEEANRRKAENARLKAEEEEEEASRRKAENTRLKAEEEEANRRKAENEARARKEDLQEELRMQAERETKTNAEYDARLKIEEEMDRRRIEDEARARAEEQARSRCDSVPLGQEHRTMSMLVNVGDDIVVDASDAAATPLRTADVASSSDKITETPPVARGDDLARTEHAAQPDSCTLADERNPKIDVLETPQRIHVEKFDHSKTYVIENYRANGKYLNWNSAQNSKSVSVLLQSNPDHASSHWRIRMVEGGCAIEPRELAPSRFLCLQHKAEPGFLGPDVHQKEGCIQLCNDATQPSSTWHIAKTPITDVYTIENANAKGNYITVTEAYATSGANTQIGRNPEDPSARWRISEHRVEHRIAPQAPAAIHQESAPAEESPSKRSCCWCCRRKPKEEERRPISATTPTAPSAARTAATGAANTEAARKTPEASSTVHKTPDSSRGATEPKPAAVISQRSQQAIGRPATSIQNREHIAIPVRPEAEDDQGDDEWQ